MKAAFQTLLIISLLLVAPTLTRAQDSGSNKLESSALVNGTIVIAADGSVQDVQIDDPKNQAGPELADMIRRTAMKWRFKPVVINGSAVTFKSDMTVRLVAKQLSNGNFDVRIKGATFTGGGDLPGSLGYNTKENKKWRPKYPPQAMAQGTEAAVYLILKVGRDGQVKDAAAEQTNVLATGTDAVLGAWRRLFEQAAINAAQHWTFTVPTEGELAKRDSWNVRIPVVFSLRVHDFRFGGKDKPSAWDAFWVTYTPGPYTPPGWIDHPDTDSADAMASGAVATEGAGPTLLTPLNQT